MTLAHPPNDTQDGFAPIKPDPNCTTCLGSGIMRTEQGTAECTCLLKQRAQRYLGPTYVSARYIKTLDPRQLQDKNIVFQDTVSTFKSIVKSFLLNTAMRYQFDTKSGHDVMTAYLQNVEHGEFNRLQRLDLLILYLVADPHNKAYSNVLVSLLEKRQYLGKPTWVYLSSPPGSDKLISLYGFELSEHLKNKFQLLKN